MAEADGIRPPGLHEMAPEHIPIWLPGADGSDPLFTAMAVVLVGSILGIGALYFTLHALPERLAHKESHVQMQAVGILALLALFTHNNVFWVLALLLAALRLPDVTGPLSSIARSLDTLARRER
ncbi:hypothetical protein LNKW23_02620 [Paralimibaculum aggregatum]|uniref:Uncharacterized protein n=1 Tax=Paralimibaculum aggregatum TaxID=3036245 RepID=A0ABQ6LFS5_9RHOB|nr:hypothetical protein [Limibaculum sp. NKW23]GMG81050.1 hypothetical protein LNKW23_02620 [Limibaculum sp. NKW23]